MDLFEQFYNKALKFLSYRPRSEKEVRDNLNKKYAKRKSWRHSGPLRQSVSEASLLALSEVNVSRIRSIDSRQVDSGVVAHAPPQNDESTIIDRVIDKLKEQKFVNDEEFTRWWIEQRTTFRPRGIRFIKVELRQKGIPTEIIASQISNFKSQISNNEAIKQMIEKKIARYKNLSKPETRQKLFRYLSTKGFEYEDIKQAIDDIMKEGV